jgi:hypothetical protein
MNVFNFALNIARTVAAPLARLPALAVVADPTPSKVSVETSLTVRRVCLIMRFHPSRRVCTRRGSTEPPPCVAVSGSSPPL